jgi:hypothetical protein
MASDSGRTQHKPGETVEKPGIYMVIHKGHREPHETSFRLNEIFPTCKSCRDAVRFELIMIADEDL